MSDRACLSDPTPTLHHSGTYSSREKGWDEERAIHGIIIVQSSGEDVGVLVIYYFCGDFFSGNGHIGFYV